MPEENNIDVFQNPMELDFEKIEKENAFFREESEKRHHAYIKHLKEMYGGNQET